MIININEQTLAKINNPQFSAYASQYLKIYEDFLEQVQSIGIDIDQEEYCDEIERKMKVLKEKGAIFRNDGKSIYINNISPACEACRKGLGSITFFISLMCPRNCFFCFNPNQENYAYFQQNKRDCIEELEQIYVNGFQVDHLALTGGEPLLHKRETIELFKYAKNKYPSVYTRLYTSGDLVDMDILKKLKDCQLDEIRFSLRMYDSQEVTEDILKKIGLAKEYIPQVMVEMPVLPSSLEEMKELLLHLNRLEIFSINLLEFCFPFNNIEIFKANDFKIKNPPYKVLYNYWYRGGLPIARSELECLELLEFVLDRKLKIGAHYCSVENKQTAQIYQLNFDKKIPSTAYFSQKDYFLKSAKVFGNNIQKVRKAFDKIKFNNYFVNRNLNYLEFPVDKIGILKDFDIEMGISSSVIETREDGEYLKELKVDLTYPGIFDLEKDV